MKTLSAKAYAKKLEAIAALGMPVADTLIAMLEEASKYTVKGNKRESFKRK